MISLLIDHNIEGQAALLWSTLDTEGWLNLIPLRFVRFAEVNLPLGSNDREIWHFAQARQMLLLTANRNLQDDDSLEQTIRQLNQPSPLPVITISDANRIVEATYRELCAARLAGILIYAEDYLGSGRLYIPEPDTVT